MNLVAARTACVESLRKAVEAHPMCALFDETYADVTVIFPKGDFFTSGVTCSKQVIGGQAEALRRILHQMETIWMRSYPNGGDYNANSR